VVEFSRSRAPRGAFRILINLKSVEDEEGLAIQALWCKYVGKEQGGNDQDEDNWAYFGRDAETSLGTS